MQDGCFLQAVTAPEGWPRCTPVGRAWRGLAHVGVSALNCAEGIGCILAATPLSPNSLSASSLILCHSGHPANQVPAVFNSLCSGPSLHKYICVCKYTCVYVYLFTFIYNYCTPNKLILYSLICLGIFINLFILFIYFWLRWVFIAACGLSLVAASGGYSLLQHADFPLRWLLLLRSTGSRRTSFSSCGTWAQ